MAVIAVLVAGVAAFEWNWLRGPLERHLSNTSGRTVRIGALDVEHALSLWPTVRLRQVFVENAPWAISKKPLATAAEIAFTVSLPTVFGDHIVLSRVMLIDAQIDMERRADGLRNWRLRKPDDRAPGRVQVRTLEARRSQVTFVNGEIHLSFVAILSDAPAPAMRELPSRIEYKGRYQGRAFEGEAFTGPVISFRASDFSFPLRGRFVSTGTRLEFEGTAADIFEPGTIDIQAKLAGPTLSDVHPFLRIRPPQSRPYALQTHLVHRDGVYRLQNITGHLGATRGTADVTYDHSRDRPRFDAVLASDSAAFDDVSPLIGLASSGTAGHSLSGLVAVKPSGGNGNGGTGRPLPIDALRSLDAHVVATAKKIAVDGLPTLEGARAEGTLREGLLDVKPIAFNIAGGQGTGSLKLDVREASASATVAGELRGARIERLVPAVRRDNSASAPMNARLKLEGRGRSATEILSHAHGTIDARIDSGSISKRVDAKLGLDYGKLVKLFFVGDRDIAIRCGALALDVRDGVGKTRVLALDTADTRLAGRGTLDFRQQRYDLVLDPQPKDPGLFAKRKSIKVDGPFASPHVTLIEPIQIAAAGC
jgi:uncharacterized protein involved in outer membrane biogenesis